MCSNTQPRIRTESFHVYVIVSHLHSPSPLPHPYHLPPSQLTKVAPFERDTFDSEGSDEDNEVSNEEEEEGSDDYSDDSDSEEEVQLVWRMNMGSNRHGHK